MPGGGKSFVQITGGAHYRGKERDKKLSFSLGFLLKSALRAMDIQGRKSLEEEVAQEGFSVLELGPSNGEGHMLKWRWGEW